MLDIETDYYFAESENHNARDDDVFLRFLPELGEASTRRQGPLIIGSHHITRAGICSEQADLKILSDKCSLGGFAHIRKVVNCSNSLSFTLSTVLSGSKVLSAASATSTTSLPHNLASADQCLSQYETSVRQHAIEFPMTSHEILYGHVKLKIEAVGILPPAAPPVICARNLTLQPQIPNQITGEIYPYILLSTGREGKLSRILNSTLTPVTHPGLPVAAAPGQMSLREIQSCRAALSLLEPSNFYLFGANIARSLSPLIHNSMFQFLGLPHKYSLFPCDHAQLVSLLDVLHQDNFGGASVTAPLKEAVISEGLVTHLTLAAQIIGAVNTIVPYSLPADCIEAKSLSASCLASAAVPSSLSLSSFSPFRLFCHFTSVYSFFFFLVAALSLADSLKQMHWHMGPVE